MSAFSLTLEALHILDAIDRRGSFAAAALELDRVPSALTYTVRKLEEDLDVLLFDRSGKRAKLTPVGQTLLKEGQHLLRAAADLEHRIKRIASGWEVELRIAYSDLFDFSRIAPLIERFQHEPSVLQARAATRLKLTSEVLGGTWDALVSGRADIAIGAGQDAESFAGRESLRGAGAFQSRLLGEVEFVFCVAPHHPLAHYKAPLDDEQVRLHRSVAVADTSRRAAPRTVGIAPGQEVLTVPTMQAKLEAQIRGLGCGWLPRPWAQAAVKRGWLVEKTLRVPRAPTHLYIAWASPAHGKALKLWLKMLAEPDVQRALLRLTANPL